MPITKPLYTAHSSATGGRNGSVRTRDGSFAAELTIPKEMGGPGRAGAINPEILFASGYAACFGSAVDHVAKQKKLAVGEIRIDADVTIGTQADGGFGLKVALTAVLKGLAQADADRLVHEADKICPYSNAIRGNVEVALTVRTA